MDIDLIDVLRKSKARLGAYYPVLRTADGTVIDGNHRLKADPNWFSVILKKVKTPEEIAVARLVLNTARREVLPEEITEGLETLVKAGWSVQKIAETLGRSERWVYKYLPEEYKHPEKAKAGRVGGITRAERIKEEKLQETEGKAEPSAARRAAKPSTAGEEISKIPMVRTVKPSYPISASEHRKPTYTKAEQALLKAFVDAGLSVKTQYPVEMDKWRCPKCGHIWIESPPDRCPECGVPVERMHYYIDLLVKSRVAVEPEGKGHDFESDEERDKLLWSKRIYPLHVPNELAEKFPWFVAEYVKLLTVEAHSLIIRGSVRKIIHNGAELIEKSFRTGGPARIDIMVEP